MNQLNTIYRIVVTKWPTDDGKPWPRWIEPDEEGEGWVFKHPNNPSVIIPLPWIAMHPQGGIPSELEYRARYSGSSYFGDEELVGFVMPSPLKRHYLKRSAAMKWCEEASLLGAECHIEQGNVLWDGTRRSFCVV